MECPRTVATFKTRLDADLARRWLHDEGIDSKLTPLIRNEGIVARLLDAKACRAGEEFKLEVDQENLDCARAILARQKSDDDDDGLPATGITACPELVSKRTDATDDGPDSEQDQSARRAFLLAGFGFALLPVLLHLYSLIVLLGLAEAKGPLSAWGKRYFYWALAIDLSVIALVILAGFLYCSGLFEDNSERRLRF
jgi:hypothetical protein